MYLPTTKLLNTHLIEKFAVIQDTGSQHRIFCIEELKGKSSHLYYFILHHTHAILYHKLNMRCIYAGA